MPKKKRKTSKKISQQSSNQRSVVLFFFGVALLLGAYLHGKVQIHVDLKDIDKANSAIRTMKQKRDNLRIRVNALQGYQHVVVEAKKQGLVFVKSDKVDKVFVHTGSPFVGNQPIKKRVVCAGMTFK